jgi:large subunit ribosomal protein L30
LAKKTENHKCIFAVRVRGSISAQREAKETLEMLHLDKTNFAVILDNRPSYLGMLKRVQAYTTWGEPSKETVALVLKERGKLAGDKRITEEYMQKTGFKSFDDLAGAIVDGKIEYGKLPNIRPLFRLRPPTKGYKGKIKKSYNAGGEAGYRGEKINELIKRMV